MDASLKAKWVGALRSDKFKQTAGQMTDYCGGYCCLGVLQVIQGCDMRQVYPTLEDAETSRLPVEYQSGLDDELQDNLAQMNDGIGQYTSRKSFPEIADWIESNIPSDSEEAR